MSDKISEHSLNSISLSNTEIMMLENLKKKSTNNFQLSKQIKKDKILKNKKDKTCKDCDYYTDRKCYQNPIHSMLVWSNSKPCDNFKDILYFDF